MLAADTNDDGGLHGSVEAVTDDHAAMAVCRRGITRVAVDVSGEPHVDLAREAKAMLVRE
jgi:hypothetical protein